MADERSESKEPGKTPTAAQIGNLPGPVNPESIRDAAERLPENDAVQKAYKQAYLADSPSEEVRAKVKIVEESPDAGDTPSGGALRAVGTSGNDTERGEKYLREKTARRWGYVPVDES